MPTTIKLKNSVTTTSAPSSLVQGEVAINITDKKVWVGNAATTPVQLLGDGGSASFTSIAFGAGTVSSPSITFTGDTNTGIYSPAADTIAFTEGGVESMRIDSSGNVGIGTNSPAVKLDVNGTLNTSGIVNINGSGGGNTLNIWGTNGVGIRIANTSTSTSSYITQEASSELRTNLSGFGTWYTGGSEKMRIDSSGNVGIGTSSPTEKLTVNGGAIVKGAYNGTTNGGAVNISYSTDINAGAIYALDPGVAWKTLDIGGSVLTFGISGTERMRIDSSGNLLVGTTNATYNLSGRGLIEVNGSSESLIAWKIGGGSTNVTYQFNTSSSFETNVSGNRHCYWTVNGSERMRITSGGNLLIGDTTLTGVRLGSIAAASNHAGLFNSQTAGWASIVVVNSGTPTVDFIAFRTTNGGANVGSITYNGSATAYNTSSDYRLKENIAPLTGALAKVSQLKPCTYTWKTDGSDGQGFIAHELQAVIPDAVTGEKDAVDEEGKPRYQGVDTSFLVATLTAAIQEQQAMIEELKQEVAALKAK